ncbi:hypothetical protein B296_00020125, partial [Ensete ventricosum]
RRTVLAMASGSLRSSRGVKLAGLGLPSLWCYSLRRFRSGVAPSSKTRLLCFSFPVNGIFYRYTGRKIDDPELLETIRLTIISNMLQYHPESSSQLAMGATFGVEPPEQKVDVDIATRINIYDDGPNRRCINANMSLQVLSNSLRYFLRRPTTEEASF